MNRLVDRGPRWCKNSDHGKGAIFMLEKRTASRAVGDDDRIIQSVLPLAGHFGTKHGIEDSGKRFSF